jgi:hypothetical protein
MTALLPRWLTDPGRWGFLQPLDIGPTTTPTSTAWR